MLQTVRVGMGLEDEERRLKMNCRFRTVGKVRTYSEEIDDLIRDAERAGDW